MILTEAGLEFRGGAFFSQWTRSCWSAAFSTTLEMNGRLLTGRKFLQTKSSPGFFSRGKTTAVLQFSGTWPRRRERFTISVIGSANTSRQDFSSHVGTGSSRQEALEDSRTISDTSSMDSAEKLSRFSLGVTGMSLETCQDFPLWFQFFWGRCQIRLLALLGQCTLEEPSKVVPYTKN